jgi:predicted chitinase
LVKALGDTESAKLPGMTNNQLQAIMPRLPAMKRDQLFPFLQAAMGEFAINTPPREAAFVAQLAHESGQFRFMEEIWGPTDAQRRYEPQSTLAARLGNTEAGDGRRFKGRGPIQITGRDNYRRYGDLLGVDLLSNPEQASLPGLAFRIAALFWTKNGLNELADQTSADAFRQMTRRINGGFNGLKEREEFYAAACAALGVTVQRPRGGPALTGSSTRSAATAPADPVFARGFEAIQEDEPPRQPRKKAKGTKKTRATKATRGTNKTKATKKRTRGTKNTKPTKKRTKGTKNTKTKNTKKRSRR